MRGNHIDRRRFLRISSGLAATALLGDGLWSRALAASVQAGPGPYGPLQPADENGIMLPRGFSARVVAQSGQPVSNTNHVWHVFPDGGATFQGAGGEYVYVSNSEVQSTGGVGAILFSAAGEVLDAYGICSGTNRNCAGGATPWGTWLTCEEVSQGRVFECDPFAPESAVQRDPLGRFNHEAVAVDPTTGLLYLTEDQPDGCLYRFVPVRLEDLSEGELQVAEVSISGEVSWHPVPQPAGSLFAPTRRQVAEASHFDGGEGIIYSGGRIYFTTKGDNRVWEYDLRSESLGVLYDAQEDPGRQLTGVDNITATARGDLFVAEDGGNMELVLISTQGPASAFLRVVGQDGSELTGPAFDPSGSRLYFSSQRGGRGGQGLTYEVSGPF